VGGEKGGEWKKRKHGVECVRGKEKRKEEMFLTFRGRKGMKWEEGVNRGWGG